MIGSKDQFVTFCGFYPRTNHIWTSAVEVTSLTTVDMQNTSIGNKLQEFAGQLLCQKDTRSNHNNGLRSLFQKLTDSVKDSNVGLARTSRHDDLTTQVLNECIQSTLLVRTELDHGFQCVWAYYSSKKGPMGRVLVTVLKVS